MVGLPLVHASGPWKPGDRSNQDCFAEWTLPNGKFLSEFSGKMNIPKQPKENHDGPPMAWWPAMWGKTFMQPCLLWVEDKGWRMVNQFWYCRKNAGWSCSKHGNDPTVNDCAKVDFCNEQADLGITTGGTISWYMRLITKPIGNVTDTSGGKYVYELGMTSPTGSSLKMFGYMTEPGTKAVGLSCENQPDYTIAKYNTFAPQTPLQVWDMVIKDQDGKELQPDWSCKGKKGIKLNCNWSDGGRKGIQASFPSADSISEAFV